MKLQLVKKAYQVKDPTVWDHDGPDENWEIVFAETQGQAKAQCRDFKDYTNIIARRSKENDRVLHEGKETDRWRALSHLKEEKRIQVRTNNILRYPETTLFFIQNGYVGNAVLFWAQGERGYTTDPGKAHKYTRQEVLDKFAKHRAEDRIWPVDHVEQHIRPFVDGQYLDATLVC